MLINTCQMIFQRLRRHVDVFYGGNAVQIGLDRQHILATHASEIVVGENNRTTTCIIVFPLIHNL